MDQRRKTFSQCYRVFAVEERHQLAGTATCRGRDPKPSRDHRRAASRSAGQQRSPTRAEMMALAQIEGRRATPAGAPRCVKNIPDHSIVGSGSPMRARTLLAVGVGVFAAAVVSSPIDAQRAGAFRGSTDDPATEVRDGAAE